MELKLIGKKDQKTDIIVVSDELLIEITMRHLFIKS